MSYQPIIIVGAPRSGTNLLRDIMTAQPDYATWPCDEINYIWRYGNASFPTDELTKGMVKPKIRKYIRSQFLHIAKRYQSNYVVEKTCANTLRLEYVYKILPSAILIHIIRDGRAAVASTKLRWKTSFNLKYILKKVRFIPKRDIPYYSIKFLFNYLNKFISPNKEKTLSFWGPKFKEMETIKRNSFLIELCAHQWAKCVQSSVSFFNLYNGRINKYHLIKYEDLVLNPYEEILGLFKSISLPLEREILKKTCASVRKDSLDKWKNQLKNDEIVKMNKIIEPLNNKLGYD